MEDDADVRKVLKTHLEEIKILSGIMEACAEGLTGKDLQIACQEASFLQAVVHSWVYTLLKEKRHER